MWPFSSFPEDAAERSRSMHCKLVGTTNTGIALAFAAICVAVSAQQPRQYTDADYAAAEKFMPYNAAPLAYKGEVNATWLDDGRFWYRAVDDSGISYVLVDPAKGT